MAVGSLWKLAQRALFSKPTPEQQLLRLLKTATVRRVVEVGVDSIDATEQMLAAIVKQAKGDPVRYTAIDPFDERPAGEGALPLMAAYRRLVATGARVRLAPGTLAGKLAAEANALADTDLVMLSRAATDAALAGGWFYLPRMCHPATLVVRRRVEAAEGSPEAWSVVALAEVAQRATPARRAA